MELYNEIREAWGRTVIIPLAQAIRDFFEGEGAPRTPLAEVRFLEPKSTPLFDPQSIGVAITIGIAFTILEPIIRSLVGKIGTYFFHFPPAMEKRFSESMWQLQFYTCTWLYCSWIVHEAEWFYKTYLCWEPPFPNQDIGFHVWFLFVIQIGWYAHGVYTHVTSDVRKLDFWPMLIHHFAALLLLYSALATGYHRCGVLTMYCLDVCDIFLHATKCARLIDNCVPLNRIVRTLGIGTYVALAVSWAYFRIYLFLIKVLYTSSFQGLHYGGWKNSDNWLYYNALLLIIYGLQFYWGYLIALTGYRFVRFGQELDDERDPTSDPPVRKNQKNGQNINKAKNNKLKK